MRICDGAGRIAKSALICRPSGSVRPDCFFAANLPANGDLPDYPYITAYMGCGVMFCSNKTVRIPNTHSYARKKKDCRMNGYAGLISFKPLKAGAPVGAPVVITIRLCQAGANCL